MAHYKRGYPRRVVGMGSEGRLGNSSKNALKPGPPQPRGRAGQREAVDVQRHDWDVGLNGPYSGDVLDWFDDPWDDLFDVYG